MINLKHDREKTEIKARISRIKKSLNDLEMYVFSNSYGTTNHSIEMIVSAESLSADALRCLETIKGFKK